MRTLSIFVITALAGTAAAQGPLYGVDFNGRFYQINTTTGAASLVGNTGFTRLNSAAMNSTGDIYITRTRDTTNPTDFNQLIKVNIATGAGTLVWDWATLHDLRGLAFADGDILYALQDVGLADSLVRIDLATGVVTDIGPTGRTDLQGLTAAPGGLLYAVGVTAPSQIFSINPATGAATLIGGSLGNDNQAVEFNSGTTAWTGRANLVSVNLLTGTSSIIGPMGITDLRGMAGFRPTGGATCYPNCDHSTSVPALTANDFQCFLNAFAAQDTYANCDHSTSIPLLTANDFQCFLNAYAAGCS